MTTVRRRDPTDPGAVVDLPEHHAGAFRQGMVLANVWLLFLVFPALSLVAGDLNGVRKGVALGLVAVFAATHVFAYREFVRREIGLVDGRGPVRCRWWFAALVTINAAAFLVGSWPMLAMLPFVVSFAVFHFSWRTAVIVCALSLAAVVALPAVGGVLGETWFFSVLVISVAAATAMTRLNDEAHRERGLLLRQLAVNEERDRVARDVHDVLGHSLTVVILKAQVSDRLLQRLRGIGTEPPTNPEVDAIVEQARDQLAEVESVSRRALTEIRAIVGGLRSADLADELAAARVVLADTGVELIVNGEANRCSYAERSLMGWVVREAVTNVVRHARATRVQIDLAAGGDATGERVLLRVADDGIGLGASQKGNGLAGLQERADAMGATLRVASGNGTTIEVTAPRHETGG